jgi:hypothetical protein
MRYTEKQLNGLVERVEKAARKLGLLKESDRVCFTNGSKTKGIAYRLNVIHGDAAGHSTIYGISDFLGGTSAEAASTLHTIAQAFEAVLAAQTERRQRHATA